MSTSTLQVQHPDPGKELATRTTDDRSGVPSIAPNWSRINQSLLWIGLLAAVAWLYFRHGEHFLALLPVLIVLSCPLMHLFGHGRHGGHGSQPHGGDSAGRRARSRSPNGSGPADEPGEPR